MHCLVFKFVLLATLSRDYSSSTIFYIRNKNKIIKFNHKWIGKMLGHKRLHKNDASSASLFSFRK